MFYILVNCMLQGGDRPSDKLYPGTVITFTYITVVRANRTNCIPV